MEINNEKIIDALEEELLFLKRRSHPDELMDNTGWKQKWDHVFDLVSHLQK